jgi:predicted nicotinamide N-methyase
VNGVDIFGQEARRLPLELPPLIDASVALPSGPLTLRRPREWADLPDDGGVEWAPIAPYWAVLWRSGIALARHLDGLDLAGRRVLELGCGLGVPSLVAARAGAEVVATDADPEALELLALNAEAGGLPLRTARFDFRSGEPPRGPFDLVVAADVLYEEASVASLIDLLPRLAPAAVIASPDRVPFERFLAEAELLWPTRTSRDDVITLAAIDGLRD